MTKQQEMFAMIRKWERSGQSKTEFARETGVSIPTFYYWYRQYQEHQPATSQSSFIELPLPEAKPLRSLEACTGEPRLCVEFPDGVRISIY